MKRILDKISRMLQNEESFLPPKVQFIVELLIVVWGGIAYWEIFRGSKTMWPLMLGGCAISFLLLVAVRLVLAIRAEIKDKKRRQKEEELRERNKKSEI